MPSRSSKAAVPKLLADLRLAHGEITVTGTPRRLVVLVKALAPRQADEETVVKGPPAERAFDAIGAATPAAVGFRAQVRRAGRGAGGAPGGTGALRLRGRPPRRPSDARGAARGVAGTGRRDQVRQDDALERLRRGLLAADPLVACRCLGETVIPFEYAGLTAGRTTRGPRAEGSPELDGGRRRCLPAADRRPPRHRGSRGPASATIAAQVAALAAEVGGIIPDDPGLLDEVTDLVEQPTALRGELRRGLPAPAQGSADHGDEEAPALLPGDRRFARSVTGMLPYFITVRNGGAEYLEVVQAGNEGVIRARYADAAYFFKADTAHKLEDFTPRLAHADLPGEARLDAGQGASAEEAGAGGGRDARPGRGRPGDHRPRAAALLQERPGDPDGGRADLAPGDHGP